VAINLGTTSASNNSQTLNAARATFTNGGADDGTNTVRGFETVQGSNNNNDLNFAPAGNQTLEGATSSVVAQVPIRCGAGRVTTPSCTPMRRTAARTGRPRIGSWILPRAKTRSTSPVWMPIRARGEPTRHQPDRQRISTAASANRASSGRARRSSGATATAKKAGFKIALNGTINLTTSDFLLS
jgi:hypothetical protein